jgi:hypothetical protein
MHLFRPLRRDRLPKQLELHGDAHPTVVDQPHDSAVTEVHTPTHMEESETCVISAHPHVARQSELDAAPDDPPVQRGDDRLRCAVEAARDATGEAVVEHAMRGSWAHDVTYTIICSLDVDDRRTHERALLAHYLDCLAAAGVQPPDPDRAWLEYRRHILHGFAMATPSALDQQSEETTATKARRCQLAAADHDILRTLG